MGNELRDKTVLVPWMVYLNWNKIDIQKCYKANKTLRRTTKLAGGLVLDRLLFENDRRKEMMRKTFFS